MRDDEDRDDHVCYFCLVFVLQREAHEAQGLVALARLPVQDDQHEGLKAEPARVELAVDAGQLQDQVDDSDQGQVLCL